MALAEGPELEMWAVCGACFQGDHDNHRSTENDRRCACVECCARIREAEIAARLAPSAVASPFMDEPKGDQPVEGVTRVGLEPFMNVVVGTDGSGLPLSNRCGI